MEKFIIIASNNRKYLVISTTENNAKIEFSRNLSSLKIRSITKTEDNMFEVIL